MPVSVASAFLPKDNTGKYADRSTVNQLPPQSVGLTSDAVPQPLSPGSPTLSLRDVQPDNSGPSQFPITNIDNPDDIAQELSNLQALRRMSIDVGNTADPDLIPFHGLSLMSMPSIAPKGEDDEGDISRLLWVPAKVHPELAPDQFKTFLEKRVLSLKRRSADTLLSVDVRNDGATGLQRKKSMLSRQFDSDTTKSGPRRGDQDGGDPTNQQHIGSAYATPELSLNELVMDPSKAVQKLAMDTQKQSESSSLEASTMDDDKPILPVPTMGLRRSTRTQYRKGGSLRSGNRQVASKRAAALQAEKDIEIGNDGTKAAFSNAHPHGHALQRVQSEPAPTKDSATAKSVPVHPSVVQRSIPTSALSSEVRGFDSLESPAVSVLTEKPTTNALKRLDSSGMAKENASHSVSTTLSQAAAFGTESRQQFPQRSSSQNATPLQLTKETAQYHTPEAEEPKDQQPPPRSSKRPSEGRAIIHPPIPLAVTALEERPTLSPAKVDGLASATTQSSSVEERKAEKRVKDKDENEGNKTMGWKWFKSEDKDKKRKEKEKEERMKSRTRSVDKAHDSARLDVLQNSIDNGTLRGRESVILDREGVEVKFRDDKRKEPKEINRKSTDGKREKDGFLVSIFGGSRKKESKDNIGVKGKQHSLSPEPVVISLRPDIDYPYTRFPIVEERAIYRMAHIKLANPRRDLRSQVLLSNFMYSYLAKVQAMHPQLNVPTSPQQKRKEEERRRREQDLQQQLLVEQQVQMQNSANQHSFEYHRAATQYGDAAHQEHQDGPGDCITTDVQSLGGVRNESFLLPSAPSAPGQQDQNGNQTKESHGYYDYGHSDTGPRDSTGVW